MIHDLGALQGSYRSPERQAGGTLSIGSWAARMLTHLQIAIQMHAVTGLQQDGSSSPERGATESAQAFFCVDLLFRIDNVCWWIDRVEFEVAIGSHGHSFQGNRSRSGGTRNSNHNSGEWRKDIG